MQGKGSRKRSAFFADIGINAVIVQQSHALLVIQLLSRSTGWQRSMLLSLSVPYRTCERKSSPAKGTFSWPARRLAGSLAGWPPGCPAARLPLCPAASLPPCLPAPLPLCLFELFAHQPARPPTCLPAGSLVDYLSLCNCHVSIISLSCLCLPAFVDYFLCSVVWQADRAAGSLDPAGVDAAGRGAVRGHQVRLRSLLAELARFKARR